MSAVSSTAKSGEGEVWPVASFALEPSTSGSRQNRQARRHPERFGIAVAAERMGLSERHVRRLVFERRIPHYKVGSRVVLDAEDCEAFLASQRREALR
jgi:excisionase family DNA binding protein